MTRIDRRQMLALSLGAAAASITLPTILVEEAHAAPLMPRLDPLQEADAIIDKAQVVVVGPRRRRRRRWVCWWHRGRRVCGWRWR
ncbi:MAG: hypothetical protein J0I57_05060 [Hyphomicrobium sp.]|nr:hypothetical protein [Hyphomicrobium sp.]